MISAGGLGAIYLGEDRCSFRVWAPSIERVEVHLVSPHERAIVLDRDERGYHHGLVEGVKPGARYLYRLDGKEELPDPASRFQPAGVHEPSQVVDTGFQWEDERWFGVPLRDYIIYELHVGTFTPEGTFDAIIAHLDELKDLGVTAVETMPVGQFPGERNWGYDVAYPFAVQHSYGGPEGLKRLVNACHNKGLAFIVDVVYNHLGPEGNYLGRFAPYFTDRYKTPWGPAINFDGPHSDEVRRYFIENALHWITEHHVDALRIDAVHAILDFSAQPFLDELSRAVRERAERLNRRAYLIAESDLNDTRLVLARELGGYGLDAQWNDDFHHCLHTLLTDEKKGYYIDFGRVGHMVKAFREGYVLSGHYSAHRRRRHGNASREVAAHRLVVFSQNHDQVGNRMLGERLSEMVSFEALKLAAGAVLLSPFLPLMFMGEEYGETAPFQYFVSHSDPQLVEAVRRGRSEEFEAFEWEGELPDPQAEETFLRSRLDHELRRRDRHAVLREFYKELIRLRRAMPALSLLSKEHMDVWGYERQKVVVMRRWSGDDQVATVLHFGKEPEFLTVNLPPGNWRKALDSAEVRWMGPGGSEPQEVVSGRLFQESTLNLPPLSIVVFAREIGEES